MEQNNQISTIFKEFRKEFGLSQLDLSIILNIKPQQVSNYETNRSKGNKDAKIRSYIKILEEYKLNSKINKSNIFKHSEPQTALNLSKNEIYKAIPFFKINVSAGNISFLDNGLIEGQSPDGYMFIPQNIDADIAFPTYGHSMHPEISNGDIVAYKLLKDISFYNYGMKYLIVTEEQRMVKYLKKHKKEGYVLLESKNPDYGSIDMPMGSIRYLLQVRYIGKTEM